MVKWAVAGLALALAGCASNEPCRSLACLKRGALQSCMVDQNLACRAHWAAVEAERDAVVVYPNWRLGCHDWAASFCRRAVR